MLAREQRLSRRIIFPRSPIYASSLLTLKLLPSPEGLFHAGCVISKKVSKSAVKRNRLRRVVSEVIRCEFGKNPPRCDLLIILKPLIQDKKLPELKEELRKAFTALNSLRG